MTSAPHEPETENADEDQGSPRGSEATAPLSNSSASRSMYLEAGIPRNVIEAALRAAAPIRLHFAEPESERRWIELDPPSTIAFEADVGIRIVTTGRFKFELAGVRIPAHLDRVEFLILPRVVQADEFSHRAALPVEIVSGDVRFVPGVIDDWLVERVNRALTPRATRLVWRFDETLSARFELPARVEPLNAISLAIERSRVTIDHHGVSLRIEYDVTFEHDG